MEGGEDAEVHSVLLLYVLCTRQASKNLETFQETSSRLPGTPLPAVRTRSSALDTYTRSRFLQVNILEYISIGQIVSPLSSL